MANANTTRIHYLDDEPELCEIFESLFSNKDREVRTFTDPQLAIRVSNENPPHIIFVDYRLPGTNGEEVAYQMPKGVPIYLMTGDIFVKTQFQFTGHFKKPFEIEEIKKTIAQVKR